MSRMRGQRRIMVTIALTAAAAAFAVGTALAHGGYGPGHGMGCGAGHGPGVGVVAGQGCGADAGPGPAAGGGPGCGVGYGPGPGAAGGCGAGARTPALLSQDEFAAHRAKMQNLASYDECKAYMAEFSKQLQARAKEKGQPVGGPNDVMCDRMKEHGRFRQ